MNNIEITRRDLQFVFALYEVGSPITDRAREISRRAEKIEKELAVLREEKKILLEDVRKLWKRNEIIAAKQDAKGDLKDLVRWETR